MYGKMESEEINLEYSCRLCLKLITGKLLRVSIFETDSIGLCHFSIPVKIKTCICIDVQAADPLPQYICRDCHNKLDDFFAFKQVCLDVDLKLKTLVLHATKHRHNGIQNGQDVSKGLCTKTIEDITIQSTIKIEPHSEEEECGLAEAMELDALSNNSDDDAPEIASLTSEYSAINERLPIRVHNTPSLTLDHQRSHEINVKGEPYDNFAMTEMPDRVVLGPIKTETTEQQPLDENISLAHYMRRKINGVHNGNFIYNIDDKVTSDNRPKTKQKKRVYKKYDTFRRNYRCESCGELFRRLSDMKAHLDTHMPTELKRFVCCVCPETFSEKKYRADHEQLEHTGSQPYLCQRCTTRCTTLPQLRQHVRTHRSNNQGHLVCYRCKSTFFYRTPFRNHVLKCTLDVDGGTTQPVVDGCYLVGHHCTSTADSESTQCEVGSRTVDVDVGTTQQDVDGCYTDLGHHRTSTADSDSTPRVATKHSTFVCNICGSVFKHKGALICHQAVHHRRSGEDKKWIPRAAPQFGCVLCDITCRRKEDLTEHEAAVHGGGVAPADTASQAHSGDAQTFSCQPCNLRFKHKGALICHQAFYHRLEMNRNIVKAKTFPCEVCHVVFARKDHYIVHKQSHKYDRPTEENGSAVCVGKPRYKINTFCLGLGRTSN